MRELPDEVVRARPVLGDGFVGVLAQMSDFATVDKRLSDIVRSLCPEGGPWPERPPPGQVVVDQDGCRSLPAAVEMYRAAFALVHGQPGATVSHARAALSLAPPDDNLIRAGAGALAGLASWTTGDLAGAHAAISYRPEPRVGRVGTSLMSLASSRSVSSVRGSGRRRD